MLEETRAELQGELDEGAVMDENFYNAVLAKIPLYRARACVKWTHAEAIRMVNEHGLAVRGSAQVVSSAAQEAFLEKNKPLVDSFGFTKKPVIDEDVELNSPQEGSPEDEVDPEDYEDWEPKLVSLDELIGTGASAASSSSYVVVDFEKDAQMRQRNYQKLIERFGGVVEEEADKLVEEEMRKGIKGGEAAFNAADEKNDHGVVELQNVHYEWEKKYRPRKPRFFNRVKTGFDWNKYNSTHYDSEVPPPKMVQGYRFNIFYPDLVDKTKTPTYQVEKSDNAETVILRFSASAPYEDIAFKIVNREWNLDSKHGFRRHFDKGVLHLYFNFKRFRYRR